MSRLAATAVPGNISFNSLACHSALESEGTTVRAAGKKLRLSILPSAHLHAKGLRPRTLKEQTAICICGTLCLSSNFLKLKLQIIRNYFPYGGSALWSAVWGSNYAMIRPRSQSGVVDEGVILGFEVLHVYCSMSCSMSCHR